MPVPTFYGESRTRFCAFVLAAASLFGASAAHSQTVTADFGGRTGSTPAVPSGLFAVGGTGSTVRAQAPVNLLTTAGLNQTRFWISLNQVYATSTPNFSNLDSTLTVMKAS